MSFSLKEIIRGIPICGGFIDGCHIQIKAPRESRGDYLNRKSYYSLLLQIVCGDRDIFQDINFGGPGRVHDARVLANSNLYHRRETGALFTKRMHNKDSTMSIELIGDPAYPLKI